MEEFIYLGKKSFVNYAISLELVHNPLVYLIFSFVENFDKEISRQIFETVQYLQNGQPNELSIGKVAVLYLYCHGY